MDPDATLRELQVLADRADIDAGLDDVDAQRFGQLFNALDDWMRRGGFPPSEWSKRNG